MHDQSLCQAIVKKPLSNFEDIHLPILEHSFAAPDFDSVEKFDN